MQRSHTGLEPARTAGGPAAGGRRAVLAVLPVVAARAALPAAARASDLPAGAVRKPRRKGGAAAADNAAPASLLERRYASVKPECKVYGADASSGYVNGVEANFYKCTSKDKV